MNQAAEDRLKEYTEFVETAIRAYSLEKRLGLQKSVANAMDYSLEAGGKRIRPVLVLEFCRICGGNWKNAVSAACAIEMIHTFSLIHDDLPAMDNDTLRRGMPTCHVKFGEDVAILAGDALLTQAFYTAAACTCRAEVLVEILKLLSEFSGANGMILGQIKDLEGEANPGIDHAGLQVIHYYKTGRLLSLPLVCAALLAGHREDAAVWERIGADTGLSFQIQDDILDVTSTVEELGKNINSDAENEKTTYVTLMGVEAAREEADRYYRRALAQLDALPLDAAPVRELFDQLMKRKN